MIDAVFGTGLSRSVEGSYASLLEAISEGKHVMSVDIPSGLDCDTGKPLGPAVTADHTITLGFPKKGFRNPSSHRFTGKVT